VLENRYRISKTFDNGGFGTVFECTDEKNFSSKCIKVVSK
jgi:hypothetical protein